MCSSSGVARVYIKSEKERDPVAAASKKKVFHELDKEKNLIQNKHGGKKNQCVEIKCVQDS